MPPLTAKIQNRFPKLPRLIAGKAGLRPRDPAQSSLTSDATPPLRATWDHIQKYTSDEIREAETWWDHVTLNRVMFKFNVPAEISGLIFEHLIVKPGVHYVQLKRSASPPRLSLPQGKDRSLYRDWWDQCALWPSMQPFYKSTFVEPQIIRKHGHDRESKAGVHVADSCDAVIDNHTDLVVISTDYFLYPGLWKTQADILRDVFLGDKLRRVGFLFNPEAEFPGTGNENDPVFACFCSRPLPRLGSHKALCPVRLCHIVDKIFPAAEVIYLLVKLRAKDLVSCDLREFMARTKDDCKNNHHLEVFHDKNLTWRQAFVGGMLPNHRSNDNSDTDGTGAADLEPRYNALTDLLYPDGANPWVLVEEFNKRMNKQRGPVNKVVGKVLVTPYHSLEKQDSKISKSQSTQSTKKRKRDP